MNNVGARIRQERLSRRPPLTLAALAGSDLSVGMLSKMERGLVNPSLSTLQTVANRLGVPLAALFAGDSEPEPAWEVTLASARTRLLLGDLAGAAQAALAAAERCTERPLHRARLLGIAAEAALVHGNTAEAAARLAEATAALQQAARMDAPGRAGAGPAHTSPAGDRRAPACGRAEGSDADSGLARAELSWLLGLLEARRGHQAAAERCLAIALDQFEHGAARRWLPLEALLHCRILVALATLHLGANARETARSFLLRAGQALAIVADPLAAARHLLVAGHDAGHDADPDAGRQGPATWPADVAAAAALAAVATGTRLREQVSLELSRLERENNAPGWHEATPPLEASHSRHLR